MTDPVARDVRRRVETLLWDLLPELYRLRDGGGDLRRFLSVLAVPLAEVRQNVEELHADLFIDSCNDWVIPYLAEMVGTRVVFPDARSNRADVRGTVAWRRRKGTPRALEEMAGELSGQVVVTQEGWKPLLVAQDLNLLRERRTIADLRRAAVAEQVGGPLDATYHAVDPGPVGARSGRYHPRHVVHWLHPTRLFPVTGGTPFDSTARAEGVPTGADLRFAVHPLGAAQPLRARRTGPEDALPADRIPPLHFAAAPAAWFGREGRFTVRLNGLPGGVAQREPVVRAPSHRPADVPLVAGGCTVAVLSHARDRLHAPVTLEVRAAPQPAPGAVPDATQAARCGRAEIGPAGEQELPPEAAGIPAAPATMLRLLPSAGGLAFFPGAIVELAGTTAEARCRSRDPSLRQAGFLAGALVVDVPPTWVVAGSGAAGGRWFHLASDGSLFDAQSAAAAAAGGAPDVPWGAAGKDPLAGDPATVGPGPAWPPAVATAAQERLARVPHAPARPPVVLHGGGVVLDGDPVSAVDAQEPAGLAFGARVGLVEHPFLRLAWRGPDARKAAECAVLDPEGRALVDARAAAARLGAIAGMRSRGAELVVRLEAAREGVTLAPCEVVWHADDGAPTLLFLPQLTASALPPAPWSADLGWVSGWVTAGVDGSTHWAVSGQTARASLGQAAPRATPATIRRRCVRGRDLSGWDGEDPADPATAVVPTPAGVLDVDPGTGRFALAVTDSAAPWPRPADAPVDWKPPPEITVDWQEGFTDHLGARSDVREPLLDRRLPRPTRLVMRGGAFPADSPPELHGLPRYRSLTEALHAVEADAARDEVVEIVDSATYPAERPAWPAGPQLLTIQAAEGCRPVLQLSARWEGADGVAYESVALRGLALAGAEIHVPPARNAAVELCTALDGATRLSFGSGAEGVVATVLRSAVAGLALDGAGRLVVDRSIVDAPVAAPPGAEGAPADSLPAVDASGGTLVCERATVLGTLPAGADAAAAAPVVRALVLEASESIFLGRVEVLDRFHGCARFCRVGAGSTLPAHHRVTAEEPRFVSRDRLDPAYARLAEGCVPAVARGAEDGSELGAFHDVRLEQRLVALRRRLDEYTPAGLFTGVVRID